MSSYEKFQLINSIVNNILLLLTIATALFLSLYPNSKYRKNRIVEAKAIKLLQKCFLSPRGVVREYPKINYETPSFTDEDIDLYNLLLASHWIRLSEIVKIVVDNSRWPSFTFTMSESFQKEYDKLWLNLPSTKDYNKRTKLAKKLAKDLRSRHEYRNQ